MVVERRATLRLAVVDRIPDVGGVGAVLADVRPLGHGVVQRVIVAVFALVWPARISTVPPERIPLLPFNRMDVTREYRPSTGGDRP